MPTVTANGVRLHYTDSGGEAPAVLFSHGLLMSNAMFAAQIERLAPRYRCIAYDHRGQGDSDVTDTGYDMETLCDDAAALIEALDIAPCHFVGLSMGGFVGMRLAARRPELVRSLCLLETSAEKEPAENAPKYRLLNFIARWFGLRLVVGQVMPILFGKTFMADPGRADERNRWREHIASNHRLGITRAVRGVIERAAVVDELAQIACPTLVIVGDEDTATVPAKAERIAAGISGSQLLVIEAAGHSSTIEQPGRVSDAIESFIDAATTG